MTHGNGRYGHYKDSVFRSKIEKRKHLFQAFGFGTSKISLVPKTGDPEEPIGPLAYGDQAHRSPLSPYGCTCVNLGLAWFATCKHPIDCSKHLHSSGGPWIINFSEMDHVTFCRCIGSTIQQYKPCYRTQCFVGDAMLLTTPS
jgi:hypothetical protein